MAFTLPNYPILTPEQANPLNAAIQSAFSTYGKGLQAAYAPDLIQAEVMSKTLAPLATISSNPMLWAMMTPEQAKNLTGTIANLLNNAGQRSNQPVGLLSKLFGSRQQPSNQQDFSQLISSQIQPTKTEKSSALAPASQGGLQQGAYGKATAPFTQSPYGKGTTVYNPQTGELFSTPTESTTSQVQLGVQGIKAAVPMLHNVAEQSKQFLEKGGKLKLRAAQALGFLKQYNVPFTEDVSKRFNISPDVVGEYNEWRANIEKLPEVLMNSFNLPRNELTISKLEKIVEPGIGEDADSYSKRVIKEAQSLATERLPQYEETLSSGYQLNKPHPVSKELNKHQQKTNKLPKGWVKMVDDQGYLHGVHPDDVERAEKENKWTRSNQ